MVCTLGTSAVDMVVVKAEYLKGKDIRSFDGQAASVNMAAKCIRTFVLNEENNYKQNYEEYLRLAKLADEWKKELQGKR